MQGGEGVFFFVFGWEGIDDEFAVVDVVGVFIFVGIIAIVIVVVLVVITNTNIIVDVIALNRKMIRREMVG